MSFFAVKWTLKLTWLGLLASAWIGWAMIAWAVVLVASAAGRPRAASAWRRTVNWSRLFRI